MRKKIVPNILLKFVCLYACDNEFEKQLKQKNIKNYNQNRIKCDKSVIKSEDK